MCWRWTQLSESAPFWLGLLLYRKFILLIKFSKTSPYTNALRLTHLLWTRFGFELQNSVRARVCVCLIWLRGRVAGGGMCAQGDSSTFHLTALNFSKRRNCQGGVRARMCMCVSTLPSHHHLFMSLKVGCVILGRNCSLSHDTKAWVRLWNGGMSHKIMTPGLLFMVHVGIRLHLKMFIRKCFQQESSSSYLLKHFSK